MNKKANNDAIAITNSAFKQRSWKIWLIAGIIVLAATGMAAYFMPAKQAVEQITTLKQPETVEAPQQAEPQAFTRGIVYERRYNDETKGTDIVLLDSPTATTKTIGNFKNTIASYALNSGDGQPPSNLTGTPYFYTINNAELGESTLKKIDVAGETVQEIPLSENPATLSISKQEDMVAWCNFNEHGLEELNYLSVLNFASKTKTKIPNPTACSLGSHRITFSQDGTKLYYIRGFYELYGEFSDEEFKQISKDNENGLHVIDLTTKQSSLIEPDYEENNDITFWSDSDVGLKAGFITILNREEDAITIKKLPDATFDYLTGPQIAALTTLDTLKIPGKYFVHHLITEDNKGIFYHISNDANRSSTELGYYNLETKQYHILEAKTQNNSSSISLFAALDEQHLYYLANPGNRNGTTLLYETDFAGTQKMIDSGSSIQKITSVKK